MNTPSTAGLFFMAHARACSRPPPPTIRTFMMSPHPPSTAAPPRRGSHLELIACS
jgi:hypothetical protein